jgi:chromosome segregation ATPase
LQVQKIHNPYISEAGDKESVIEKLKQTHHTEVQRYRETIDTLTTLLQKQNQEPSVSSHDAERIELQERVKSLETLVYELKEAGKETLYMYEESLLSHQQEMDKMKQKLDSSERRISSLKRLSALDDSSSIVSRSVDEKLKDEYEKLLFDYAEIKKHSEINDSWIKELEENLKICERKLEEKDKLITDINSELVGLKESGIQAMELYDRLAEDSQRTILEKDATIATLNIELTENRKHFATNNDMHPIQVSSQATVENHHIRYLEESLNEKTHLLDHLVKAVSPNEQIALLTESLQQLGEKVHLLEDITNALEKECAVLSEEKAQLTAETVDSHNYISQLEKKLSNCKCSHENTSTAPANDEKSTSEDIQGEIHLLKEFIALKEGHIESLTARLDKIQNDLEECDKDRSLILEEKKRLELDYVEMQNSVKRKWSLERNSLQKERDELAIELRKALDSVKVVTSEKESRISQLEMECNRLMQFESSYKQLQKEKLMLQDEKCHFENLASSSQALKESLKETQNEKSELELQLRVYSSRLDHQSELLRQLKNEKSQLASSLDEAQTEMRHLQYQLLTLSEEPQEDKGQNKQEASLPNTLPCHINEHHIEPELVPSSSSSTHDDDENTPKPPRVMDYKPTTPPSAIPLLRKKKTVTKTFCINCDSNDHSTKDCNVADEVSVYSFCSSLCMD